jgi:hypothetical protein
MSYELAKISHPVGVLDQELIQTLIEKGWKDPEKELPKNNTYVLIWVPGRPWSGSEDQVGLFFKVAKFQRGISMEERDGLHFADLRKKTYCASDEHGNNRKPYYWREFGPGGFFGQEVVLWKEIF